MANKDFEFLDKVGTRKVVELLMRRIKSAEGRCLSATDGTVVKTVNGKIPSEKLPSYIDDILEFDRFYNFGEKVAEATEEGLTVPIKSNIAPASGVSFEIVFDESSDSFYALTTSGSQTTLHSTWNTAGTNWQDQSANVNGENVTYVPVTAPATGKLYFASETEKLYRWVPAASGTGGTMLDITSKTIYNSAIDSEEVTSVTLGNLPAGTTAESLKSMTISEILDTILFSDDQPIISPLYNASLSLAGAYTGGGSGVVLIGSPAPTESGITGINDGQPGISATVTRRQSNYKTPGTNTYPYLIGAISNKQVTVKKPGDNNYGSLVDKLLLAGKYTYKLTADYAAGDKLYTKRGNEVKASPISAGSIEEKTASVIVTYPMYTNGEKDTSTNASLISDGIGAKAQANKNHTLDSITETPTTQLIVDVVSVANNKKGVVINYPLTTDNGNKKQLLVPQVLLPAVDSTKNPGGKGFVDYIDAGGNWVKLDSDWYTVQQDYKTMYSHGGTFNEEASGADATVIFALVTITKGMGECTVRYRFHNI